MSNKIPDGLHRKIQELVSDGYSTGDIAKQLGLGPTAVLKYSKIPYKGKLDPIQEHRLLLDNRQLQHKYKLLLETKVESQRYQDFITSCLERAAFSHAPKWTVSRKSSTQRQGIPTLLFSDAHLDETVYCDQVGGRNGYDRATAQIRVRNMFENTIKVCRDYWKGVSYPGICLAQGGDTFSGFIHEELAMSNAGTMMESLLFWLEPIAAGIKLLADDFGHVIIPSTVGNHPRNSRKPVMKNRVVDNFDWLFMQLLVKLFDKDKKYRDKLTWIIPQAADTHYQLFGTKYCLTHGDQFRGGSGIAGALSPLMIGYHKKLKRAQALGNSFDYLVAGHWHQLMFFKGIVCNGSLKGYDEYAFINNFDYEEPRQALWLTDINHGITLTAPVHVKGKVEPWMSGQVETLPKAA
jgi:predicted transcriptional regulator